MLDRNGGIRQIENWKLLELQLWRVDANFIARFDPRLLGMKAPLRNFFITRSYLDVGGDDRVQTYFFNSVGDEVNTRAVLCLICITGGVDEVAGLCPVVLFRS